MGLPSVQIYTDGACEPNPGSGGWGAILRFSDHDQELYGGDARTTNNRMELQAAISALKALSGRHQVHLYTDSQYLRLGITEWLPTWIARGWRRAGGQPVLNVDLWKELHSVTQRHVVEWHWLRGHAGHVLNERADRLARQAMRRRSRRLVS